MEPVELITMLASKRGKCFRLCAYCDDDLNTAEFKECVEKMQKEIYILQSENDRLLMDLIKLRAAYKQKTGEDYEDSNT